MPCFAVIHSPQFCLSEYPNVFYVKGGEKYLFLLSRFCNQSVNGLAATPSHAAVRLRISTVWSRIISHCYTNEIFKGPGLEPGGSNLIPGTRIWYDDKLRTIEHQLSCGFRKLPVSTNHGSNHNLPFSVFERADIKRFTGTTIHITADVIGVGIRFLQFVFAEVADKHFGIVEHHLASVIENGDCVLRQRLVCFQIGDCNIHFQVSSQRGKSLEETALLINR